MYNIFEMPLGIVNRQGVGYAKWSPTRGYYQVSFETPREMMDNELYCYYLPTHIEFYPCTIVDDVMYILEIPHKHHYQLREMMENTSGLSTTDIFKLLAL